MSSTETHSLPANAGWLRSRLPMRGLAMIVLVACMFSQGLGGALTVGVVPLAGTSAIVFGFWLLFAFSLWQYGTSMFDLGARGQERTRIFQTLGGGFTVDAALYRWFFVIVIGITSVGINLGIPEADASIGTGPRTAIMTLGTLLAGVVTFVVMRQVTQIVMRVLLLGGVVFAVALFSGGGSIEVSGLLWAAIVGLHMFCVQKALTAFGTERFATEKENKKLSQRYRDSGMTLANGFTFFAVLGWAWAHDGLPTPDKFEGAVLPALPLYLAIPLFVMVLPVLGMNWARNHVEETEQAMVTSTAPIMGAIAALSLALVGWANTPALDAGQWVGIGIVVLAALGAGIDVSVRAKVNATLAEKDAALAQKDRELEQFNRWLEEAHAESSRMVAQRDEAYAARDAAVAQLTSANAGRDVAIAERVQVVELLKVANADRGRLQTELDTLTQEAEPSANLGGKSVSIGSLTDVVVTSEGIRFAKAGGFTIEGADGVSLSARGVGEGFVGNDGHFKSDVVSHGTVKNGGVEIEFARGEAVEATPAGYSIGKLFRVSSTGASSVE